MPHSTTPRHVVVRDIVARSPRIPAASANGSTATGPASQTSHYFGVNTFGVRQMRDKLPRDVYAKLVSTIRKGKKLDLEIAPTVAQVIKEWAISRGVTHFTHWFQPQTGLTAEKHDTFLTFEEGQPVEAFTGAQLIQSEPDASSFPSGGLRATWEARGYTAWNPASPVFIVESGGTRTLCVPSVFVGYNGEALDEMTPLLRSTDALSARATALLELLGDTGVERVFTTLGIEQEYFLIDRQLFALRPDFVMSGRTLVGAPPPRGQQLEDHYFGGIPERAQALISEAEHELYKLGVPIATRHNEVAPSQFEMAPHFEDSDIAVDHNQLVMATLRRVALRHGMQAVLHEKPFAGINGSGKHCNWSMSVRAEGAELDGFNLLKPGSTPHQNIRFLVFLASVLKAVYKHQGLLRAGVATSGNEHRLGANEAPPAIISVFMGETLTRLIADIIAGKTVSDLPGGQRLKLGVDKLPEILQDNTDRNRTSPFAFTGSKFEFRAVGSAQSPAFPIMLLNAAVAEAIGEVTEQLRERLKKTKDLNQAVIEVVRDAFKESAAILFEGNNYSEEWVKEAEKRGLLNLRRTPEALAQFVTKQSRALFEKLGILSKQELESRYHVRLERYVKDMLIEAHTQLQIIDTMVLPAALDYASGLYEGAARAKSAGIKSAAHEQAAASVAELIEELQGGRAKLVSVVEKAEGMHDELEKQAKLLTKDAADAMATARHASDALELAIADERWPLPKYRELLFPV